MADILTPDLCVIGAGPGGLSAAMAARAIGASVVVVERDKVGGGGLYSGALPAQALLAAAAHAQSIRDAAAFGVAADVPKINMRKVHDHVHAVVAATAPAISAEHLTAAGVQVIKAEAKFLDAKTVVVGETQIRARRFVLATGARSVVPPIPGLNTVPYFTTETIFDNTRKLTHLLIVGAGAVGIELAQAFHRLGSAVTVIESGEPLLGFDPELVEVALRRLRDEGVDVRGGTNVSLIQSRSMGIGVSVKTGEREEMLDVSHILVASGRVPNFEGLELGKAGIRTLKDDASRLDLDARRRTSNPRVYAVGDVAGDESWQSAEHAARTVVHQALLGAAAGRKSEMAVPRLVHADPEIAEVGLSEPAAKAKLGDRYQVLRASYAGNERAAAWRQGFGTVKLIVGSDGKLLGAGVVGAGAGELIALLSLAMAQGLAVADLSRFVAPYPSFADLAYRLGAAAAAGAKASPITQRLVRLNRMLP